MVSEQCIPSICGDMSIAIVLAKSLEIAFDWGDKTVCLWNLLDNSVHTKWLVVPRVRKNLQPILSR